jgi:hypothetical protein
MVATAATMAAGKGEGKKVVLRGELALAKP